MAKRPYVSVCMIARDEEAVIGRAIRSVRGLADEVIVVDTGSRDHTTDLARQLGARVYAEPWRDDFSATRNAALARARGEWILTLDADEYFEADQARKLRALVPTVPKDVAGLRLQVVNVLANDPTTEIDRVLVLRAFRNRPWHRYTGAIHEQIEPSLRYGRVAIPGVRFFHDGYDPVRTQERGKIERNWRLLQRELERTPAGDPNRYYLHMQLGVEATRAGKPEEARRHLEAAMEGGHLYAAAGNRAVLSIIVRLYVRAVAALGEPGRALEMAERILRWDPLLPAAVFARGWAKAESGEVGEGVRDLLWAIALEDQASEFTAYASPQDEVQAWLVAVAALVRRGAVAPAAAMLVHALRAQPRAQPLVASATALVEAMPAVAGFVFGRAPQEALWPIVRQAAREERLAVVQQGAKRLRALADPFAPVAEALVAIGQGDRSTAYALLASVDPESPAAPEARYALARLETAERPASGAAADGGKQGEVVA